MQFAKPWSEINPLGGHFRYGPENGSALTAGGSWVAGYLSQRSHLWLPMASKQLAGDPEVPMSQGKGQKGVCLIFPLRHSQAQLSSTWPKVAAEAPPLYPSHPAGRRRIAEGGSPPYPQLRGHVTCAVTWGPTQFNGGLSPSWNLSNVIFELLFRKRSLMGQQSMSTSRGDPCSVPVCHPSLQPSFSRNIGKAWHAASMTCLPCTPIEGPPCRH